MKILFTMLLMFFCLNFVYPSEKGKTSVATLEMKSGWKFKQADKKNWLPAVVPGCVHTDLLDNKLIPDPFYRTNEKDLQWIDKVDWEYETVFEVDDELLKNEHLELIFKGLDTYADVFLNSEKILSADNMFREWKVECKQLLKLGSNTLKVFFHSPVKIDLPKLKQLGYALPAINDQSENGGLVDQKISPFARKAPYHYGWDWGPRFVTSGIWRPIYLRAWNSFVIENVQFVQNSLSKDLANIVAHLEVNSSINDNVELEISHDGKELASKVVRLHRGTNIISAPFEITSPKFWYPNGMGEQYLYNFSASLNHFEKYTDVIEQKIGLRTVEVVQENDENGTSFYFKVNGTPVFMKGANYIPSDIFLNRVATNDYEKIIKSAVDANMNMLRVWGGGIYENDIFYDLCDKYGILVWQDFMFACSMYPGDQKFLENVRQEAIDNVKRLRNHPSIAIWVGNNEIDDAWSNWGWKQKFSEEEQKEIYNAYKELFFNIIPTAVKLYDGTRFYWPSSPNSDFGRPSKPTSGDYHYWGVWHGKEPFENFQTKIARFLSEYGFQSFPEFKTVKSYTIESDWNIESEVMAAHQRSGIGNLRIRDYLNMYYKMPKDFESFLYVGQVLQAYGIQHAIEAHRRAMPYCMGSMYWQIDDCWPVASWSSTDYYKRWKAVHYKAKKAYEPVIISPVLKDDNVDIFIVSDKLETVNAFLELKAYQFNGKEIFNKTFDAEIKPNTSAQYFSLMKEEILNGNDERKVVMIAELKNGNEVISRKEFFFEQPKNLLLDKPEIKLHIVKNNYVFEINLSTNILAKDVYLSLDEEGFFSDNYFDLIPSETKVIEFKPNQPVENIEGKLKVMSLIDSY